MIDQATADRYLEDKRRYEAGELELSPEEVELRRRALLEFGEELERKQGFERSMFEKARAERVRRNFNDLETLGGNYGEEEAERYRWAIDHDAIRARLALTELFAAHYEVSLETANEKFDVFRMDYGNKRFGGKIPKTNVEFWHAEKAKIEHEEAFAKESNQFIGSASVTALGEVLKGEAPNATGGLNVWKAKAGEGSLLLKEVDDERLGAGWRKAYGAARGLFDRNPPLVEAAQMMARKEGRYDLLRDNESATAKAAGDEPQLNPLQQQARLAAFKLAKTGEAQPTTDLILDKLMEVPKEDVRRFFDLMPAFLAASGVENPEAAVATFIGQLKAGFLRGYSSMMGEARSVEDLMEADARLLRELQEGREARVRSAPGEPIDINQIATERTVAMKNAISGFGTGVQTYSHSIEDEGRPMTARERLEAAEAVQKRIQKGRFFFGVEEMSREMNPLRAVTPFKSAEMGAYALAESAPMMLRGIAASFVPVAGPILAFLSSADAIKSQEFQRLVTEFPDIDIERAGEVARWSGLAQAVPEMASTYGMRLGGSLLVRKAPNVAKALERISNPASAFWTPFVTRTGAGVIEETGEEAIQGAISALVQNAILKDYPQVDVKKAFLDNISPEVGFASLFMRLPAVGAGTWSDSRKVREGLASPEMMRGLGLSEDVAKEINGLANEGKFNEAEARLREEYGKLPMKQIEAGAQWFGEKMNLAREVVSNPEADNGEMLQLRGDVWSIVKKSDGSEVASFGLDMDAAQAALEERELWFRRRQEGEHDGTVRRYAQWFRERQEGRVFEETGETRTVEQELEEQPLNVEAVAASIRMARIEAGYDPAKLIIKGSHVEELREGIYRDVVRLYKGADFTTVIEENAHAQLQADLREGRVTLEEAAEWTREWAAATGFKLEDAANPTRAEIQEAVADMAKAHFLNERKRLPDKPKVWGLLKSLRVYLREVFGRAKQLIQMREDGRLSESAESYLARTLGMNEQMELNQKTLKAMGMEPAAIKGSEAPATSPTRMTSYSVGEPTVKLTGEELGKGLSFPELRKKAAEFMRSLRGQSFTNQETGHSLLVDRKGQNEPVSNQRKPEELKALPKLKEMIEGARYKGWKPDSEGRADIIAWHYYAIPVEIEGRTHEVTIAARELKDGKRFYDSYILEEKNEPGAQADTASSRKLGDSTSGASDSERKIIDGGGNVNYSIGHASYLEELAASKDASTDSEAKLKLAEAARGALESGRARVDFLERELIYEQKADARMLQLEEDVANLQLELERGLEELRQQRAEQIEKAGTESMAKFMDRIEAAKTERERMLLRREARETAADLKRGIEKDFKRQEQALREKFLGKEKLLREKALGVEKAERLKANFEDARAATINSLVDYNRLMMALPAELRGKLGGFVTLAKLKTDKARDKFFREKFPKVAEAFEKHLRKEYDAALKAIFKKARPKGKAGEKPSGKLGAELHSLFATLEEAVHWDAAQMEGHVAMLEKREADGTLTPEQEDLADLEKALVNLVADWKNADSGRRGKAVKELKALLSKGLTEYRFAREQERTARKERREKLRAATGSDGSESARSQRKRKDSGVIGKRIAFLRAARLNLSSFEQVLFLCFGEHAEAQRLADMEREAAFAKMDADHAIADRLNELLRELAGGKKFAAQELHARLSKKSLEVRGIAMSELEAISVSMMWRQEDGRRHMEGRRDEDGNLLTGWSYDQAFVDEVEALLSPEALAIREFLTKEYEAEYARVNAVYRKLNGVDLPRHLFYSPITVKPMKAKAGEMVDPTTGVAMSAGSSLPGSLRTRGTAVAEPEFKDVLLTFMQHKAQMNHWMAYAEFVKEFQSVVGHRDVMNAVEASGGEAASRMLGQWLDYFAQGGNRDAGNRLELVKGLSGMVSRASAMAIVGRAGVLAVQSTQLLTALSEMPTASYLKRMGMLAAGQLEFKAAWKSDYIQRRLKEMPPVVRQLMEGLNSDNPTRIKYAVQMLGRSISGADALFTAGTYAIVYDYRRAKLLKGGMGAAQAEAQAHFEAERITDRLAQPMRAGARSMIELRMSGNPTFRMAWNFASEARKNLGVMLYAMTRRGAAQAARTVMAMWVLQALASNLIRAAWRDARDDEDDDIFDEKNWDATRMGLAVLTEPLAGIPVLGDAAEAAVYAASGKYLPSNGLLDLTRSVAAIKRAPDEKEAGEVLRDVETILTGMGLFSSNLAAAASLSHIARDLFGVTENVTEE